MPIIPFALQCTIPENRLFALKDSLFGRLDSAFVSSIPGFKYYLSVKPNGSTNERRGQTWIFLEIKLGNVKKVEAEYTYFIESANYSHKTKFTFEKTIGWGHRIAKTEDFFSPEKKFIADGKCTIIINGVFKFDIRDAPAFNVELQKWDGGELGNGLWEDDGDKDFTIAVDGKEIKVHKLFLRTRSDVFKAMFNPETKESIEKKVEIPDFSFEVVETALKMIYHCNFVSSLSSNQMMSLLQFFDKYQIPLLKEKVELFLINQVSAATVCRLMNASILTNSINLNKKCMEFLKKAFASKTPLSDIEILDKDVAVQILQNMVCHTVEIQ